MTTNFYVEKGVGKIQKISNNKYGSEDYYIILDANGNCVNTIPQRIMQGNLHDILLNNLKNSDN